MNTYDLVTYTVGGFYLIVIAACLTLFITDSKRYRKDRQMKHEKIRVHCRNCGAPLEVYIAANGQPFCDQSCRAFWEATNDPEPEKKPPPDNEVHRRD